MSSLRGLNISRTMEPMVLVRTSHNFFNEILETWIQKEIMQKNAENISWILENFFSLLNPAMLNLECHSRISCSHKTACKSFNAAEKKIII